VAHPALLNHFPGFVGSADRHTVIFAFRDRIDRNIFCARMQPPASAGSVVHVAGLLELVHMVVDLTHARVVKDEKWMVRIERDIVLPKTSQGAEQTWKVTPEDADAVNELAGLPLLQGKERLKMFSDYSTSWVSSNQAGQEKKELDAPPSEVRLCFKQCFLPVTHKILLFLLHACFFYSGR
jgi:hypothetical protein